MLWEHKNFHNYLQYNTDHEECYVDNGIFLYYFSPANNKRKIQDLVLLV